MTPELLAISGLSAGYGSRPVLDRVSLTLRAGERAAIIGPNGCGKSTLLRAVTAEVPETHGTIRFGGEDITHLETEAIIQRGIGYARQTRNIFPGLTVTENLELACANYHRTSQRDPGAALNPFSMLDKHRNVRAGLLSGGERQALAVAMVLLKPIRLLLLDEPIAGLGQKAATELLSGVFALQREHGFAVVVVEHRLRLIHPFVCRVIIMVGGSIAEDTTDVSILEDQTRLGRHYLL